MAQEQNVFKRMEKKYIVNQRQYKALQEKLEGHMRVDEYGLHKICNLYLDTEDFRLIRTSVEKPFYKEKLRIRSYGIPKPGDEVFLELKKKCDGVVYKRRVKLSCEKAMNYVIKGEIPEKESQVLKETDWFLQMYQPVPKVYISYDRTAWFGKEEPELRVTFDKNILYREKVLDLTKGSWGTQILDGRETLMEIKIPGSMPIWLAHTLSELCIYPHSFSKYGTCYQEFIADEMEKGGMFCA